MKLLSQEAEIVVKKAKRKRKKDQLNPKRVAVAGVVCAFCLLAFLAVWRGMLADHYARRAQRTLAAGEADRAVTAADRALALNKRHGYAALFKGMALQQQGHPKSAAEWLRRAEPAVAHPGRAARYLALSEESLGGADSAIDQFRRALAIEPLPSGAPGEVRGRLGRLLLTKLQWAKGAAQFRRIIGDSPESRFPFEALGLVYEHFGAQDLAVACESALLLSERHAARACGHLKRLAGSPEHRRLILGVLGALRDRYAVGSEAHDAINRLERDLSDDS